MRMCMYKATSISHLAKGLSFALLCQQLSLLADVFLQRGELFDCKLLWKSQRISSTGGYLRGKKLEMAFLINV